MEIRTSEINNRQSTARPVRSGSACKSLLDFDTEEAVTSAADSIASSTSDSAFCQTSLKHEKSFIKVLADDLPKTSNYFAVRTMFGALVKEMSALGCSRLGGLVCGGTCEQVEDAIVVYFVHADDNGEFGGLVDIEVGILDDRELRHARNSRHVALGGHGGRGAGVGNEGHVLLWLRLSLTSCHRALEETEYG